MATRKLQLDRLAAHLEADPFISLAAAGGLLPGARPGAGVSASTVYRWATQGLPGPGGEVVRLAAWRLGRKWVTTRGALVEFIAAQQPDGSCD